jgi:hypothetical protein
MLKVTDGKFQATHGNFAFVGLVTSSGAEGALHACVHEGAEL